MSDVFLSDQPNFNMAYLIELVKETTGKVWFVGVAIKMKVILAE